MHQRDTPWMDGASMISQCPIGPGQSFLYRHVLFFFFLHARFILFFFIHARLIHLFIFFIHHLLFFLYRLVLFIFFFPCTFYLFIFFKQARFILAIYSDTFYFGVTCFNLRSALQS